MRGWWKKKERGYLFRKTPFVLKHTVELIIFPASRKNEPFRKTVNLLSFCVAGAPLLRRAATRRALWYLSPRLAS